MDEILDEVADYLRGAERVLFITGAGISADSGLPTYRGVGGLYQDQLTTDEMPIEVVLSSEMLNRRPELTWKYVFEIETACRGAVSNRGHQIIARALGAQTYKLKFGHTEIGGIQTKVFAHNQFAWGGSTPHPPKKYWPLFIKSWRKWVDC